MGNLHHLPDQHHRAILDSEETVRDLLGATSALRLAIDGLEALCEHSQPTKYQFRGLYWLAKAADKMADDLDKTLYPAPDGTI